MKLRAVFSCLINPLANPTKYLEIYKSLSSAVTLFGHLILQFLETKKSYVGNLKVITIEYELEGTHKDHNILGMLAGMDLQRPASTASHSTQD